MPVVQQGDLNMYTEVRSLPGCLLVNCGTFQHPWFEMQEAIMSRHKLSTNPTLLNAVGRVRDLGPRQCLQ